MKDRGKFLQKAAIPLVVAVAVVFLEFAAWLGWRLPNPSVVLLPLVMISTLVGGLGAGLAAGVMTIFYFVHTYSTGSPWPGTMAVQGWTAITATALAVPLAELVRRRLPGHQEERLRLLADNIAQMAWMADKTGSVFWTNRRFSEYTGAPPEAMVGRDWLQFVRPDYAEPIAARVEAALRAGEPWRESWPIRGRDGVYHWFLTEAVPARDGRGRIRFWFGTSTDITLQVEAGEELMRQKDALVNEVALYTAEAADRAAELRKVAVELTSAEQRERGRLSQVLHDDLQQLLVAAKIQAAAACRPDTPPGKAAAVASLLNQAIETARSLSKELAPTVLYEKGLGAALHWLQSYAHERYGLTVEVETREVGQLEDRWLAEFLFGVVRELLLNVAKHAGTDTVRLVLVRDDHEVQVVVEDFGKGFDVEAVQRGQIGSGLSSVRQRVHLLGGEVGINSSQNGTRVEIRMPLKRFPAGVEAEETANSPLHSNPGD